MKKPRAFDVFAGCGGMTEGFKKAGYKVIGAIEIDPHACDAHACCNFVLICISIFCPLNAGLDEL